MQSELTRYEMTCPYNGEVCCDGIRSDFKPNKDGKIKQCRMWTAIKGKDPQGENLIDFYDCAHAWVPVTNLEMAQRTIQSNATMQEFRNETHQKFAQFNRIMGRMAVAVRRMFRMQQEISQGVPLPSIENKENNGHEN